MSTTDHEWVGSMGGWNIDDVWDSLVLMGKVLQRTPYSVGEKLANDLMDDGNATVASNFVLSAIEQDRVRTPAPARKEEKSGISLRGVDAYAAENALETLTCDHTIGVRDVVEIIGGDDPDPIAFNWLVRVAEGKNAIEQPMTLEELVDENKLLKTTNEHLVEENTTLRNAYERLERQVRDVGGYVVVASTNEDSGFVSGLTYAAHSTDVTLERVAAEDDAMRFATEADAEAFINSAEETFALGDKFRQMAIAPVAPTHDQIVASEKRAREEQPPVRDGGGIGR